MAEDDFFQGFNTLRERFLAGDLAGKREAAYDLRNFCEDAARHAGLLIAPLLELAVFEDAEVATSLMAALSGCGAEGRAALLQIVSGPPGRLRAPAAFALGLSRNATDDVIVALSRLLDSDDCEERAEALRSFGSIGYYGHQPELLRPYVAQFIALLDDPDPGVRDQAAHALRGSDLPDEQRFELALRRLDPPEGEPDPSMRDDFLQLLRERDPLPYLPLLLKLARDGGVADMLDLFARLGPKATEVVPLLEAMLAEDTYEALDAGAVIYRITGRTDVLARMRGQLREAPDEIAGTIWRMGPGAAPMLDELADVLDENFDDPDWDLPGILVDALLSLESVAPRAIAAFTRALAHESSSIQYKALIGLRRAGPAARSATRAVRDLLGSEDEDVAELARSTLLAIESKGH